MGTNAKPPEVVQLFATLEREEIGFMVVGMSAANLQGVLASTLDLDVWVELPVRQYIRVLNVCHSLLTSKVLACKVFKFSCASFRVLP